MSPHGVTDGLKLLLRGADEEELAALLRAQRVAVGTRTAAGLQKVLLPAPGPVRLLVWVHAGGLCEHRACAYSRTAQACIHRQWRYYQAGGGRSHPVVLLLAVAHRARRQTM